MSFPNPLKPRPKGARKTKQKLRASLESEAPISHGYFKSFDDTRLFYTLEGAGRPLVFCYGMVCSSLHWTYQIEHFRRTHQAIWFDYRGHQNSDIPAHLESLTVESMARDLGLLMDELKIEDALFLGHSMGVNVVLEFYRQQPHRFQGMVLANGTARRPLETLFHNNSLQSLVRFAKRAYDLSPDLLRKLWKLQKGNPIARTLVGLGGFNPHLTPKEDIDLYVNEVIDMDPGILLHLINNYDQYDATSWLHEIQTPTLILAGEQDYIVPLAQQELLHQLIPESKLEVIRKGSHCPQMDLPELVNSKIEAFLQSIRY